MKKLIFALIALTISFSVAADSKSTNVDVNKLPTKAIQFIQTYYPKDNINIAIMERDGFDKDYKVMLKSGTTVKLDNKGDWTDIKSNKGGAIPKGVISDNILQKVKRHFPNNKIVNVERDNNSTELELDNGGELEFNKKGEIVDMESGKVR